MKNSTFAQKQAGRLAAAELFAKDISITDIARIVGFGRQCVSTWYQVWLKDGVQGLSLKKPGAKPKVTQEQIEEIEKELLLGPEAHGYNNQFWTLERIGDLINKKTGVDYSTVQVWRLMQNMNWSCQKPECRANQRNEEAIAHWKEHDWPRIKRGRKSKELH